MPIKPFRDLPKNLVEWGRFFQQTDVTPSDGSVGEDQLADGQVTFQKIQNVTPDRLLGRDTTPAGVVQELAVTGGLEFTGSGIQRSALTGDITAAAGDAGTEFRDFAAVSVLGRSANSVGAPAEIAAASNGHYLRRSGNVLAFGAIDEADIPATIARDSEVNSAISAAITALNLASGTYTPTVTNVTNLDASTGYAARYLRIGDIVLVSGRVDVDPTAAATTSLRLSLPVASNFANTFELSGAAYGNATAQGAAFLADTTNDEALMQFIATDTANRAMWFNFTYLVI